MAGVKQFVYELLFRANSAQAKAAAKEVQAAVAEVTAEAKASASAADRETDATGRNVEAKRRAARVTRDLAAAEREAKAAAEAAVRGGAAPATTAPRPTPSPTPTPSPAPGLSDQEREALRARYVPVVAAQRAYQAELANIRRAETGGALSAEESAAALARLQAGYDRNVEAIRRADAALRGNTGTIRLAAHERRILNLQISDTVQSLALGMPVQQVLLQQGPQITDLFGGIGGAARAAAQALTLSRLAIGGVAAAAGVGAVALTGYLRSTKEVDTAAAGLGRGMAGSSAEMEAAAHAGAAAAGISVSAARSMEAGFLRTGRIGHENFERLIGVSKDFGATVGLSAAEAGDALADLFRDPGGAVETLSQQYGLLDAATVEAVRNLAAQNRVQEAQTALLDGLTGRLVDAREATTALARAWDSVKTGASDALDAMGGAIDYVIDGPSRDDRIEQLQAQIRSGRRARGAGERPEDELARLLEEQRAEVEAQSAAAARQRGNAAWDIARSAPSQQSVTRETELRNQIATLQAGLGTDTGLSPAQTAAVTEAIQAKERALAALVDRQQVALQLDRLDIQIANERNPLLRAELEARRERLRLAGEEVSADEAATAANRVRQRVLDESIAGLRAEATDMRAETEIRAALAAQVAAGLLPAGEMNAALQEELKLRPLVAAAALAEGDDRRRLTAIVEDHRAAYEALAAQSREASADQAGRDYLRGRSREIEQLRLEVALLGQSAEIRARALALAEAEARIRDMHLASGSGLAEQIRQQAEAQAAETVALQRQVDAWGAVQRAGEEAIDGIVASLKAGDLGGVLDGIATEIETTFTELAITNPLKNAIFGTSYGTISDVGGLGGIAGRLTGAAEPSDLVARASTMSVGAMSVTATTVTIAGGLGGLATGPAGAALPALTGIGGGAGLTGAAETQQQIWDYFSGRGLAPHQVAAILGNVQVESGFDPLAVGDSGTSIGLFQHRGPRAAGLIDAVGPGGLGSVQAQLDYTWAELQGRERGVLDRLLAAPDLASANAAFLGFERPAGWTADNPAGTASFDARLQAADAALKTFGETTATTAGDLGTLGGGFGAFGDALTGALSGLSTGGPQGGLVGLLGSVAGSVAGALGVPGFAGGGRHLGGLRIVGEQGPELEYTGPSTILPADLTRALLTARPPALPPPAVQVQMPAIQIVNNSTARVDGRVEETTDASGQRQMRLVLSDAVADAVAVPGGRARGRIATTFGLRPAGIRR